MIPVSVFDQPQASIVGDDGPKRYGNVDNAVEVTIEGRTRYVYVAVPTWLFTFMRDVGRINPETEVTLALDQIGERYVLSMLAGEDLYDLWSYSRGSLPVCFK